MFEVKVTGPSTEEYKNRSCAQKVKYGHKKTADRAVRAMTFKGCKPLESYFCKFCDGWHIGAKQGLVDKLADWLVERFG